jgi:hypothetical protein
MRINIKAPPDPSAHTQIHAKPSINWASLHLIIRPEQLLPLSSTKTLEICGVRLAMDHPMAISA